MLVGNVILRNSSLQDIKWNLRERPTKWL